MSSSAINKTDKDTDLLSIQNKLQAIEKAFYLKFNIGTEKLIISLSENSIIHVLRVIIGLKYQVFLRFWILSNQKASSDHNTFLIGTLWRLQNPGVVDDRHNWVNVYLLFSYHITDHILDSSYYCDIIPGMQLSHKS